MQRQSFLWLGALSCAAGMALFLAEAEAQRSGGNRSGGGGGGGGSRSSGGSSRSSGGSSGRSNSGSGMRSSGGNSARSFSGGGNSNRSSNNNFSGNRNNLSGNRNVNNHSNSSAARSAAHNAAQSRARENARNQAMHNARNTAMQNARNQAMHNARNTAMQNARNQAMHNARNTAMQNARNTAMHNARQQATMRARTIATERARTIATERARSIATERARTLASQNASARARTIATQNASRRIGTGTSLAARTQANQRAQTHFAAVRTQSAVRHTAQNSARQQHLTARNDLARSLNANQRTRFDKQVTRQQHVAKRAQASATRYRDAHRRQSTPNVRANTSRARVVNANQFSQRQRDFLRTHSNDPFFQRVSTHRGPFSAADRARLLRQRDLFNASGNRIGAATFSRAIWRDNFFRRANWAFNPFGVSRRLPWLGSFFFNFGWNRPWWRHWWRDRFGPDYCCCWEDGGCVVIPPDGVDYDPDDGEGEVPQGSTIFSIMPTDYIPTEIVNDMTSDTGDVDLNGSLTIVNNDEGYGEMGEVDSEFIPLEGLDEEAGVKQYTRFLRLANGTDSSAKVHVLYETPVLEGDFQWIPNAPADEQDVQPLVVDLEPGEVADFQDGDWKVHASRVRIWVTTENGEWSRFRDTDLWLVPEVDPEGEHTYQALAPDTFVFTVR